METVTVTLSRPIKVGDETRPSLTMREPLIEDQLAVSKEGQSRGDLEVALIARLVDVPIDALKKHPLRDYQRLQKALEGFLS